MKIVVQTHKNGEFAGQFVAATTEKSLPQTILVKTNNRGSAIP
jgi:hypothetical protein